MRRSSPLLRQSPTGSGSTTIAGSAAKRAASAAMQVLFPTPTPPSTARWQTVDASAASCHALATSAQDRPGANAASLAGSSVPAAGISASGAASASQRHVGGHAVGGEGGARDTPPVGTACRLPGATGTGRLCGALGGRPLPSCCTEAAAPALAIVAVCFAFLAASRLACTCASRFFLPSALFSSLVASFSASRRAFRQAHSWAARASLHQPSASYPRSQHPR